MESVHRLSAHRGFFAVQSGKPIRGGVASQTLDEMVAVGRQMQGEASSSGWVERGVCAAAAPGGVRRATARHRRLGTARGGCRSMRDADAHATARQGAVA